MATFTFTVDNVGADEAVVAQSDCDEIWVWENALAATQSFTARDGSASAPAVTHPPGTMHMFTGGPYSAGTTVGFVATTAGSITMAQEEKRRRH